jgi:predicted RNase H-like HicB family nuclease
MSEITFEIEQDEEDGSFSAAWPDPGIGGIATSGRTLSDLQASIVEAVELYFEGRQRPSRIKLHFVTDPNFLVEASHEVAAQR